MEINLERRWVWGSIDASGDCWEWTGKRNAQGYGRIRWYDQEWLAHRLVYTLLVKKDLTDLELDHLCFNRGCVNPDHLEPVTHEENLARMRKSTGRDEMRRCHRGHYNQYFVDTRGKTVCRACGLIRAKEARERKKREKREASE